jgi:hypothetical protein
MAKRRTDPEPEITYIQLKLTVEEAEVVGEAARLSGLKLATYAKQCLLRSARSEVRLEGADRK